MKKKKEAKIVAQRYWGNTSTVGSSPNGFSLSSSSIFPLPILIAEVTAEKLFFYIEIWNELD